LAWGSSTDPVAPVTGYALIRNGVQIATTAETFITDTAVTSGQTYTYSVYAYSDGDNFAHSAPSASVTVTINSQSPTATPLPTSTPLPTYSSAGFTTWNGTFDSGNKSYINATQVTTGAQSGTLQSITIYLGSSQASPANHIQVALYSDNGSNAPAQLLKLSASQVIANNAWNTISLGGITITPNTKYFLAFEVDGNTTQYGWSSTSNGVSRWKSGVKFGTWPSPFGKPSYAASQRYAIFMTYK
jgi:hypothetical protein